MQQQSSQAIHLMHVQSTAHAVVASLQGHTLQPEYSLMLPCTVQTSLDFSAETFVSRHLPLQAELISILHTHQSTEFAFASLQTSCCGADHCARAGALASAAASGGTLLVRVCFHERSS